MKNVKIIFIILTLCIPYISFTQEEAEREFLNVFHSITSERAFSYVAELSSDKYNGRLSGTPEYMESAKWTALKFKDWGIKPLGDDGSYFQYFDMPDNVLNNTGELQLLITAKDGSSVTKKYYFPDDYFPGMNSDNGNVGAEVVYVGHGVTAPELGYDDYGGMDVRC